LSPDRCVPGPASVLVAARLREVYRSRKRYPHEGTAATGRRRRRGPLAMRLRIEISTPSLRASKYGNIRRIDFDPNRGYKGLAFKFADAKKTASALFLELPSIEAAARSVAAA